MSNYKRSHPRTKEGLPAEVIAPGNKTLFVATHDVSRRGVQLACDAITVQEIFGDPHLSRPTKVPGVILKLRLGHSAGEPQQIEAECRAVYLRRVSEQEYRIGLQIDSLSQSSRAALSSFVDECLALR